MPVPRLFESRADPREHWVHVLASLAALSGAQTRAALVAELAGEELPGADIAQVRERQALGDETADLLIRGPDRAWSLALVGRLTFDEPVDALAALHQALGERGDRAIVVVVSADRRPPSGVQEARSQELDVRHRSWLRVRDWVQERPERGGAAGVDLLLLREAEYFLTPRVAELYRLESAMPRLVPELRGTLATVFFDLQDIWPAPLIAVEEGGESVVFPRSGEPRARIDVSKSGLALSLAGATDGPGFDSGTPWARLAISQPEAYARARSSTLAAARSLAAG